MNLINFSTKHFVNIPDKKECEGPETIWRELITWMFSAPFDPRDDSAFSPDLDGCVATGSTKKETEKEIQEAIEFHLEDLRSEGFETPLPRSYSKYFEIPA